MKLSLIDTRGRSCPEPVLMTKKALQISPEGLEVLVDNMTARENVTRYAKNSGYNVEVKQDDNAYVLSITK
ncbi:MAG: sulfurtransferase TusA family protein [Lutispora sp.]|nr:sulfurtransferase TusA family protein [Lutispora sp.]